MIEEGNIRLRAVEREDLEQLKKWRNRWHIRKVCREYRLLNDVNQEGWFGRLLENRTTIMFAVLNDAEDLIGCCGLTYINWLHRRTEVSVYIGEEEWQKKGYAMDVLKALIKYAFEELNMHKLEAEIFDFNKASVRLFEKAGFQKSGMLPQHHFTQGKYHDSCLYYLLDGWYHRWELEWQKEEM